MRMTNQWLRCTYSILETRSDIHGQEKYNMPPKEIERLNEQEMEEVDGGTRGTAYTICPYCKNKVPLGIMRNNKFTCTKCNKTFRIGYWI